MTDDTEFKLLPPKIKRPKFRAENNPNTAQHRLFPDADDLPGQQALFEDWLTPCPLKSNNAPQN